MKYGYYLLLALVISGCTATLSRTPHAIKQYFIATTDAWVDTDDGREIPVAQGDTLLSTSYESISDMLVGSKTKYFVVYKGEKGFIMHVKATAYRNDQDKILPEYDYNVSQQPTTFTLLSPQDKDAWARANYYVANNSDMKIQVSTEFLIDTYNPTNLEEQAFTISRFPQSDKVQYEVKRGGNAPQECAYFIHTGKTRKDFYLTN